MTTAPVKSLADEQVEEIVAHNMREAYAIAEQRGYTAPPIEQYAEPVHGGRVLQVLRYRKEAGHEC